MIPIKILVPMCADLLHVGHINLIDKISELGEVVIGLHSDEFIEKEKGKPLMSFDDRHKILFSIKNVSDVIKLESWKIPKEYNVIAHGDDWRPPYIFNGVYINVPHTKGISSSLLKGVKSGKDKVLAD